MSAFRIQACPLPGLSRVERLRREDARGFFSRFFCADELAAAGFDAPIAQINHTRTHAAGTVRGLHFQYPPHAEVKFVSVLRGAVFDVAVDLRRDSRTFLCWHGETLSADNGVSLLIPRGFAHGFQTLSEDCELMYLHSSAYAPAAEGALHAQDPRLRIGWPLPVRGLSARDAAHPMLTGDWQGIAP